MKDTIYVIFNAERVTRTVMDINRAELKRGEYYAALTVNVPNEFFAARPVPRLELNIPAPYMAEGGVQIDAHKLDQSADQTSHQLSLALSGFGRLLNNARGKGGDMAELAEVLAKELIDAGVEVRLIDAAAGGEG